MPPKVAVHSPDSTPMSQLLVTCGEWGAAERSVNANQAEPTRRREARGARCASGAPSARCGCR
jgi:hypothetical protein